MNQKRISFARLFSEISPHIIAVLLLFLLVFIMSRVKSYTLCLSGSSPSAHESTTSVSAKPENVPYITDVRIVAEHDSSLGIFDSNGTLLEIFTLDLLSLSPSDRQLLKKGLQFESEGEMRDFLESLDS